MTERVYCVFTEGFDYYSKPILNSVFSKETDALEFAEKLKKDDENNEYKLYFLVSVEEFEVK